MTIMKTRNRLLGAVLLVALPGVAIAADGAKPVGKVSYFAQVRPIFQAHCQGCHQPSKAGGDYVMTSFNRLLASGESKSAAIVRGKPELSHLVEQITPVKGEAPMPKGKPALSTADRKIVGDWIAQGATDDTPASASTQYDQDHPPVYRRPPVIGAIDFSPDGSLLAIGGFHEVLLWKADGTRPRRPGCHPSLNIQDLRGGIDRDDLHEDTLPPLRRRLVGRSARGGTRGRWSEAG
jgi:mono/diheme cytochrome c family protein